MPGAISDSLSMGAPQDQMAPPTSMGPTPTQGPGGGSMAEGEWEDRVVMAAENLLYDDKSSGKFMKTIAGDDYVNGIAQTVVTLVTGIDEKSGGQIPEEDILPASMRILDSVIELREAATGQKVQEQELKQIASTMISSLAQAYGTTPEQAQAFMSELDDEDVQAANQFMGQGV